MEGDDYKLLPRRIDWYAQNEPGRVYVYLPKSDEPRDGFRPVTYVEFADAINEASWWLDRNIPDDEIFAYWGPSDLRWTVLLVAAIKTGRKMLFPSIWLSINGLLSMLDHGNCTAMLCDESALEMSPFSNLSEQNPRIRRIITPRIEEWSESEHYPYDRTWAEAADEEVVHFHTSGTTGTCKPVIWSNRRIGIIHNWLELGHKDPSVLLSCFEDKCLFVNFVFCNTAGQIFLLFLPVYFGMKPVISPINKYILPNYELVTPELVRDILQLSPATGILSIPRTLNMIVNDPETLQLVNKLDTIIFGGAVLPTSTTDKLRGPKLINMFGQTETYPIIQKIINDHQYMSFHPASGCTFEPYDQDLFEMVVKRDNSKYQAVFYTFPELDRFHTGDIYSQHPTDPDLWKMWGRKDDFIILSNGQLLYVAGMERAIETHLLVKTVLICAGSGIRPLLLVEPKKQSKDFLDRIWPAVEDACKNVSSNATLTRDRTVVTTKMIPRTIKLALDRQRAIAMLVDEIRRVDTDFDGAGLLPN